MSSQADMPARLTTILPADGPQAIERAAAALQLGELVAFPTDTVYGVGAVAWNATAVAALFRVKERSVDKAIPVLINGQEMLESIADRLPVGTIRLIKRFWPGPLTLIVPRGPAVSDIVTAGGEGVAVRVPDHRVVLDLIDLLGKPLAATSANISGQPSPVSASQVLEQLGGRIKFLLDGGSSPAGVPSTVVDLTGSRWRVLRPGPIELSQLKETLG
ncbi:MAG: L-threonylcarbamoyladenylate synthase [Chloroflexota bacterium]|nr:L-threonylcarbamoyladenylate synthase [Chloroflexota bacterium]